MAWAQQLTDVAAQGMYRAPHGIDHVEHDRPSPAYVAMLETGLRESRGWGEAEIVSYFERVLPPEDQGP